MTWFTKPTYKDFLILSFFCIFLIFHPRFMDVQGRINLFEVGIYLPGIQSALEGAIPYRDFFHLRGPFEVYMPAMLMKWFGMHINVLHLYFYAGNGLCLILCVLIAKELLQTRLLLYLMTPVLVARTFPRVTFMIWGGMRYAFGLFALWFMIQFFKSRRLGWMLGAGLASGLGLLTSVEMGIYPSLGLAAALTAGFIFKKLEMKLIAKALGLYLLGMFAIVFPLILYLAMHGAFFLYLEAVWSIVTNMQNVIDPHFVSTYPRNFPEAFAAMINPGHINFRHMTPSYLYLLIAAYMVYRVKNKTLSMVDLFVACLAVYGFVMYNTGFRGIWAAQFEMALQPEKILLFFMLEVILLALLAKRREWRESLSLKPETQKPAKVKIFLVGVFCFALIGSSLGYVIQRLNHRFFTFKFVTRKLMGKETASLYPLAGIPAQRLEIQRAHGLIVPVEHAQELKEVNDFIQKNVAPRQKILTYPDLGTYNFLFDRPYPGKFPLTTFTWFNDRWHAEFMRELQADKPPFVILEKNISQGWKDVYLALEPNRRKHQEMMDFIVNNYTIEKETVFSYIMRRK